VVNKGLQKDVTRFDFQSLMVSKHRDVSVTHFLLFPWQLLRLSLPPQLLTWRHVTRFSAKTIKDIDAVQGIKVGYDSENSHILDLANCLLIVFALNQRE
jgi:hypothetical protein